ncbi:sulfatase family protein [Pseudopedobacter beijingensis]|uniref:Arylsulfatase n=1 Tax=Pseudopedobacter beijingensis TaxID=1207056 RepID=A0ABW4IEV1_9SPHI
MKRIVQLFIFLFCTTLFAQQKPNIVLIYADDLGFGDVSCYGATKVKTPNIDALAKKGLKFNQAYATSSTCTPSRFSLLTGKYAWRKSGTNIAPGDASLIIPTNITTLPGMLKASGYKTAAIGKWHLGLGGKEGPNWNGEIKKGPLDIGFDYCFVIPATADRVPTVYLENKHIVNLDSKDPILVSYHQKVGNEPTGAENPELLKMKLSEGHAQTIVNGISRIGYMSGGHSARWKDEDLAVDITRKSISFIEENKNKPFFLYLATNDIHVPRSPNTMFVGKSGLGPRGDVILQLDWTVGQIMKTLDSLQLSENTLVIFSSDNGPVLDDGYVDFANEMLNGHKPAGIYRGGKYSAFDAGTRVPFIASWPGAIGAGVSEAKLSQVDLYHSLAQLVAYPLKKEDAPDSFNQLPALMGKDKKGRAYIIQHALNGTLSYIKGDWKYIEPGKGPKIQAVTHIELGNSDQPQLYDMKKDPTESKNLSLKNVKKVQEMARELNKIKNNQESRFL